MKPAVLGVAGEALTADERALLAAEQPMGVILFARNIGHPDQVRALTDSIRELLAPEGPCLWVDQEGGRVQRLGPPHWESLPAAAAIGAVWARSPEAARRGAWLSGRIIADQVAGAGFDVACIPVLDLAFPETHKVIGNRAFGPEPEMAAALARSQAEGLLAGGVLAVSKHWPGHGRAAVDSHQELPTVTAAKPALLAQDLESFRLAADCAPIAMTGHLLFQALDAERPATLSPSILHEIVRGYCGFEGFLVSDDLDMKALSGSRGALARQAVEAGCDGVLQCSGDFPTMRDVLESLPPLSGDAEARLRRATRMVGAHSAANRREMLDELRELTG